MPKEVGFIHNEPNRIEEFDKAVEYFKAHPTIKKLSRKQEELHLHNSYIKLDDGTILALSSKILEGGTIAVGQYARCKKVMDRDGNLFVVKIETSNTENQQQETAILSNLKELLRATKTEIERKDSSKKYYTHMNDLGKSLDTSLWLVDSDYKPSLARKIAWKIHQLHSGDLSSTHIGYVHLDIKPSNMVLDSENEIHLIDFGTARLVLSEDLSFVISTSIYQPSEYADNQLTQEEYEQRVGPRLALLGLRGIDQFALKRTLFLPSPAPRDPCDFGACLFSREEYSALPERIQAILDTTNMEIALTQRDTPLQLATLFLLMECHLNIDIFDQLDSEAQVNLCQIASKYTLPISEQEEEEEGDEHVIAMKQDITIYIESLGIDLTDPIRGPSA
ncbi:MAG: phosphotransferase [Legionellales bacterium]|nr:phosphotransferase [Legionellales bacterium]